MKTSRIINARRARFAVEALRWHISHYILRRDFPLLATFQLTNRCNLYCRMCNLRRNPKISDFPEGLFGLVVKELGGMGCLYTSLSGGEPLLIENIMSYLEKAKEYIPYVNLVTNGYIMDRAIVEKLAALKIDMVSVSVDGLESAHDYTRGIKGSFKKAISAVRLLKEFHIPTTINTVIAPWNLNDLIPLTELTESLGALHKFQAIYRHPDFVTGRYDSSRWEVSKDAQGRIENIIDVLKKKKHIANSKYYLTSIPTYFKHGNKYGLFNEDCLLPFYYCEFLQNGKVFPCIEGMGWNKGYFITEGLKALYQCRSYKGTIKKLNKCRKCRDLLTICYAESRIIFPMRNLIKYSILRD